MHCKHASRACSTSRSAPIDWSAVGLDKTKSVSLHMAWRGSHLPWPLDVKTFFSTSASSKRRSFTPTRSTCTSELDTCSRLFHAAVGGAQCGGGAVRSRPGKGAPCAVATEHTLAGGSGSGVKLSSSLSPSSWCFLLTAAITPTATGMAPHSASRDPRGLQRKQGDFAGRPNFFPNDRYIVFERVLFRSFYYLLIFP